MSERTFLSEKDENRTQILLQTLMCLKLQDPTNIPWWIERLSPHDKGLLIFVIQKYRKDHSVIENGVIKPTSGGGSADNETESLNKEQQELILMVFNGLLTNCDKQWTSMYFKSLSPAGKEFFLSLLVEKEYTGDKNSSEYQKWISDDHQSMLFMLHKQLLHIGHRANFKARQSGSPTSSGKTRRRRMILRPSIKACSQYERFKSTKRSSEHRKRKKSPILSLEYRKIQKQKNMCQWVKKIIKQAQKRASTRK